MELFLNNKTFLQWSGGKDSALAYLYAQRKGIEINLLTIQSQEELKRVSMHGISDDAVRLQAEMMNIASSFKHLKSQASYHHYEEEMLEYYNVLQSQGYDLAIGGDILLQDVKKYREALLLKKGIQSYFPIFGSNTGNIIEECEREGIVAIICAVNSQYLGKEYIGKILNKSLQSTFPDHMDPAGENGEYHTFVIDAPFFVAPLNFELKEISTHYYKVKEDQEIKFYFGDFDFYKSI